MVSLRRPFATSKMPWIGLCSPCSGRSGHLPKEQQSVWTAEVVALPVRGRNGMLPSPLR